MKQRLKAWGDAKVIAIVGVFAFDEDGELLLLQRHSDDLGGGQWGTVGGRIDKGEAAIEAMRREFYEETGIRKQDFDLLGEHEVRMPHGTVKMTSYHTAISKNTRIELNPDEHQAFAWFSLANLLSEENLLWGIPTILRDFGLLDGFESDPTLADGSSARLLKIA